MLRLFFTSITVALFVLLTACSSVSVPQVGAVVPCQIQSIVQVEAAVRSSLAKQHWEVVSVSEHAIQAHKTLKQMKATIDVVFGYRGFSIEYLNSENMDYDVEHDTINPAYTKWAYKLKNAIQEDLKKQAALNPSIKCLGKDTPN